MCEEEETSNHFDLFEKDNNEISINKIEEEEISCDFNLFGDSDDDNELNIELKTNKNDDEKKQKKKEKLKELEEKDYQGASEEYSEKEKKRMNLERQLSLKELEIIEKENKLMEKTVDREDLMKCLPSFSFTLSQRRSVPKYHVSSMKNKRPNYLILLRESDYKKRWYLCNKTIKELIKDYEEDFDGYLHLINVKSIEDDEVSENYPIQGIVSSHIVYIMLPKERIYVTPDIFPYKYLESQHEELKHIFALLGAKSIKWNIVDYKEEVKKIDGKIEVNIAGEGAGLGFENSNSQADLFKNSGERTFPDNKIEPDVNKILNDSSIYYLMMEDSWKEMIKRRIESNIQYDKFSYIYQSKINVKKGFDTKLKDFDIQFNYQNNMMKKCEIFYEVEYYN